MFRFMLGYTGRSPRCLSTRGKYPGSEGGSGHVTFRTTDTTRDSTSSNSFHLFALKVHLESFFEFNRPNNLKNVSGKQKVNLHQVPVML